ncbi:LysR substrate-binding domain-containing protein [Georgenia satyanarayanai]|uniref:LysR substrate-binding domain-containing protein n=1 Tax=Georgenia satyanarayanai TaxID=860221 RepID=UPI001263F9D9|nr:LysR substrate-binding domain-containing protein [Georgenia satyanarayanai]
MAEPFRVGFAPGVSPGKWFTRWEERLPDSPLAPRLVEPEDQRRLLAEGELDMCFVRLPLDRDGLHLIPLYEELPVVVAGKDHPVTTFDEVDVADLAAEHLLQDAAACPEWAAVAEEVREGRRVEPPPMTVAQAVEVAASGAGILVLPMSVARLHQRKDVRAVPVTGVATTQVGLAWRTDNADPRVETFVGIVRGRTERSSRQPDARPADARPTDSGARPEARRPGPGRGRGAGGARRRGGPGPRKGR